MSRASRRRQRPHAARTAPGANTPPAAAAPNPTPVSRVRAAPTVRPQKADTRYQVRHLGPDIRRTFLSAGICLLAVIVAYLVFR